MYKLRVIFAIAAAVLVLANPAWCQSAATVDEQFAVYHQALSGTAEEILRSPAERESEPNGSSNASLEGSGINFNSSLTRVQQLRPLLDPILREEGVPTDVAAVVLVESGGRPAALSSRGALGLWQLMPDTARRYGLMVAGGKDERLDVVKASRAAARYLRDLYVRFGDWPLAFAAYNAGEQAVQRAMARSGSNDFQRLNSFLPTETRAYVPAVIAARSLFAQAGFTEVALNAARTAHVLYASAQLDD